MNIMIELGYLKPKIQESIFQQDSLIEDMLDSLWNMVSINEDQKVHQLTLKIYLTAIEGVFYPWMSQSSNEDTSIKYIRDE